MPIVAVTGTRTSTLARAATVTIDLGPLKEACSLGLAPSTSTTAMLAMGDALALVASRMREFRREDFARFHPAGNLGRRLSKVDDHMRPLAQCRVAPATQTVRQVFVDRHVGRAAQRERSCWSMRPANWSASSPTAIWPGCSKAGATRHSMTRFSTVMTAQPCTVPAGSMMVDAIAIMAERKISELPVDRRGGRPVGLLDITDVVAVFPDVQAGMGQPGVAVEVRSVVPAPKFAGALRSKLQQDHPQG